MQTIVNTYRYLYIIVFNTKEFEGDRMRERRMTDGVNRGVREGE